jgi:hypothetical protein
VNELGVTDLTTGVLFVIGLWLGWKGWGWIARWRLPWYKDATSDRPWWLR